MAYVALVSLMQTLEQITNTDGVSIPYEKQGLVDLLEKLSLVLNFLEESSQKSSKDVKSLERRIRNAAHHAEDIIEGRSFLSRSESMMSDIEPHTDLQKISIEIDSILEEAGKIPDLEEGLTEIDAHMEEARKINDESGEQNLHARNFSQSKPAPSGQNSVVGFGEDLKKVRDRLCNEEQPQLQVIPIVGMGGSGKTTLAMSISDDSYVKYYFDIRAWVTLSQQYSVRDILLSLLDDIVVYSDDIRKARDEQLKEYVHKNLKCKRYLIVVDDVWSKKAWNEIQMLFPNDNNGSRIILTTRLTDVADYVSSSLTRHQMHFLKEEDSWNLFLAKVFGKENCPPEFVDVGMRIAKKLSGASITNCCYWWIPLKGQ